MPNSAKHLFETITETLFGTACRIYTPARHWIGASVLMIFVAMIAAVVTIYPSSNWDVFAYTASVLEDEVDDPDELHRQSYAYVRENVPDGQYITLTQDRGYRIRQATDPHSFSTMLGFYRIKVLYIETAKLFAKITNPVTALRWISIGSSIALGLLLFTWLAQEKLLSHGPIVVTLLILSGFPYSAELITPDLYAALFIILGGYLYLNKQDVSAVGILVLAFLIRPDHLAFIGVFFFVAALYGPGRWVLTACFAICFGLYMFLTRGADHPGWWIHMWFTHVEYVPTLEGFNPDFSILAYLKMLVRSTVRSLINETWLALLFMQLVFLVRFIDLRALTDRTKVLLYSVLLSIPAKYVVFPHFETRFYLPYLVITGMILLTEWNRSQTNILHNDPTRSTRAA